MASFPIKAQTAGLPRDSPKILKIVLTGGPCAGKSTAAERMKNELAKAGYRIFVVPEAATLMFKGGSLLEDIKGAKGLNTDESVVQFQTNLMLTQIHLEGLFESLAAHTGLPSVLICDRGIMDGRAYMYVFMMNFTFI